MITTSAAIIGAGPSGLMAADCLSRHGMAVTVYDQMPTPGRKFLMAGRGGLNITHSEPLENFIQRYGHAQENLKHHIDDLGPEAVRCWCHELGEQTFVGSSGRVFPRSMKASPLLRALLARLRQRGVVLKMQHQWLGWNETGTLLFRTVDGTNQHAKPDTTLLALGGASWPKLGATGQWTHVLAADGIAIAPLRPANVAILIKWAAHFQDKFAGLPLKNIALKFSDVAVRGEAIINRHGIEGGAVYAISSAVRDACVLDGRVMMHIDLHPELSLQSVVLKLAKRRPGASSATWLRQSLGLTPVAINLLREASGQALPTEPYILAQLIKNMPLICHGVGSLERAISTAGGVKFSECDEHLMLKRRPGVFIAGEMLDWDAPTGGYLLQAALATGVAAAKGMMGYCSKKYE